MSCSSGCGYAGEFSPLKNTWTRQSSWVESGYDPYPNNKPPCQVEGYCGGSGCSSSPTEYNGQPQTIFNSNTPLTQYTVNFPNMQATRNILPAPTMMNPIQMNYRESFVHDTRCCSATPYSGLGKTWNKQKPFTT